jgi:hypothetical protein
MESEMEQHPNTSEHVRFCAQCCRADFLTPSTYVMAPWLLDWTEGADVVLTQIVMFHESAR